MPDHSGDLGKPVRLIQSDGFFLVYRLKGSFYPAKGDQMDCQDDCRMDDPGQEQLMAKNILAGWPLRHPYPMYQTNGILCSSVLWLLPIAFGNGFGRGALPPIQAPAPVV